MKNTLAVELVLLSLIVVTALLTGFAIGKGTTLPNKSEAVFMLYKSGRVSFTADTMKFEANNFPVLTNEELKALTILSETLDKIVVVPREEIHGKY